LIAVESRFYCEELSDRKGAVDCDNETSGNEYLVPSGQKILGEERQLALLLRERDHVVILVLVESIDLAYPQRRAKAVWYIPALS
jgi:hypothetical protein